MAVVGTMGDRFEFPENLPGTIVAGLVFGDMSDKAVSIADIRQKKVDNRNQAMTIETNAGAIIQLLNARIIGNKNYQLVRISIPQKNIYLKRKEWAIQDSNL